MKGSILNKNFIVLVLVATFQVAQSKLQVGDICTVEYKETGNGPNYVESGTGENRCDNGLTCFTDADDGSVGELLGRCHYDTCHGTKDDSDGKVTICHRTCSENNPWVRITIDESAWSNGGCQHQQHSLANCNGVDTTIWGDNQSDYLLKSHGTRAEVEASLGNDATAVREYWKYWERACPYVRSGQCCDWDGANGLSCCGVAPPPPEDVTPPEWVSLPPPFYQVPVPPSVTDLTPYLLPENTGGTAIATDDSGSVAVLYVDQNLDGTIFRGWTATDPSGNEASPYEQLITYFTDPTLQTPSPTPSPTNPPTLDSNFDPRVINNRPCSSSSGQRLLNSELGARWNITNPRFSYGSNTFELDYQVSDYITEDSMVKYELYNDVACTVPYTGNALDARMGTRFRQDWSDLQLVPFLFDMDPDLISRDLEIYSEERVNDFQTAVVDFCVRVGVFTPPIAGELEVNFLEVYVRLDVDLTDGFDIGVVNVAPLDKCEFSDNESFEVEGYFCEEGSEATPVDGKIITQGELVKVCVRPEQTARENSFVRMRDIREFTWRLPDNSLEQPAIVDFEASGDLLTEKFCERGYAICHFESLLYAGFFTVPGEVLGSGIADVQFGGEQSTDSVTPKRRRRLGEGRRLESVEFWNENRFLQADGESSEFNLQATTAGRARSGASTNQMLVGLGATILITILGSTSNLFFGV